MESEVVLFRKIVPALGGRAKCVMATVVFTALAALPSIGALATEVSGVRIALVVGNGAYTGNLAALRNPVNDARLMARTLRGIGFAVTLVENADRRALADAVVAFGNDLRRSGDGGAALFYYAGHGVQSNGANYLIPVDAQVESERYLKTRTVPAALVLEEMEDAPTALNIVVLDACRNNPYSASGRSVGGSRGLARMDTPPGSFFLAYSAAAGQVAADGDGANSVYTEALAGAVAQPGLELEEVFKQASRKVRAQTGGAQVPWREGSWDGSFHFVSPPGIGPAVRPEPVRVPGMIPRLDPAEELWNQIRASSNAEQLERFMRSFPNSPLVHAARARLDELTGSLTIQTVPNNALIRITSPEMPYQDKMSIHAGDYEFTIDAQGYVPFKQRLSVNGDAIYRVSLCKLEEQIETICEDQEVVRYRNERESSYEVKAIEYSAKEDYMEQGYRNGLSQYESNWSSRKEEIAESRFCYGVREKAKRSEKNRVLTCEEGSGAYIPDSYEHEGCDCIIIGDYDIDKCTLLVSWKCDLGDVREPYKTTERKCHNEKSLKQVCPDNMVTKLR